jgi:hypothetical protein
MSARPDMPEAARAMTEDCWRTDDVEISKERRRNQKFIDRSYSRVVDNVSVTKFARLWDFTRPMSAAIKT